MSGTFVEGQQVFERVQSCACAVLVRETDDQGNWSDEFTC